MTRSPLDFPCSGCQVSAGRYCDGPDPCVERVSAAAEADAQAEAVRAVERETVERCRVWLTARANAHPHVVATLALSRAADELSLEVLP